MGIGLLLVIFYLLLGETPFFAYLGVSIMLLIVVGGLFIPISILLTILDIVQSKTLVSNQKIMWAAIVIIPSIVPIFGLFAATAYYYLIRKKN